MKSPLAVFRDKRSAAPHNGRARDRLAMVSLYDAPTAALCCAAGADALLVGDSLGNVILGYPNTIHVTMNDMECHGAAVVRGVERSGTAVPVIIDMPFGSYHGDATTTVENAARLMRTGAQGLKLEGAAGVTLSGIERLVAMGVPVMGHLGFTPQSSLQLDEVVQGRTQASASTLLRHAVRLQDAGCFAVVLEAVAAEVAATITDQLAICTVGIGAGPACDGQVLVWHDIAGYSDDKPYKFAKHFASLHRAMAAAAAAYVDEVHAGRFPAEEHAWAMPEAELTAWRQQMPRPASQTHEDH